MYYQFNTKCVIIINMYIAIDGQIQTNCQIMSTVS